MRHRVPVVLPLVIGFCSVFLRFGTPLRAQGSDPESIAGFYSPTSAAFAADGRTLYITNSARGSYGMLAGRGGVSRCHIDGNGGFTIDDQSFVDGLNAPVDVAVLPKATAVSPAGALVVAVGGSWTTDNRGKPLATARERETGLVIASATNGEVLGKIYLGEGTLAEPLVGHPMLDPCSVAADPAGNIYVADFAARGTGDDAPGAALPGIWKLEPAAIDALVRDEAPPADSVGFIAVASVPTGLAYSNADDALYWITGNPYSDLGGAVLRLPQGDLSGEARLKTVAKNLNSLAGIGLTPEGTVLVSRTSGEVLLIRGRRGKPIHFRHDYRFLSPGQIATTRLDSGSVYVVVPEGSGGGNSPWRHEVRTFLLPEKY